METPYQINYAIKKDGNGRTIETSLLLNLRGESLPIVVTNFQTLRSRLQGDFAVGNSQSIPVHTATVQERPHNNTPAERCPDCHKGLVVVKTCRKPTSKWYNRRFACCSNYVNGCLHFKPLD
ncbi:MAG: hypothetical protein KGJ93_01525 [Patescibacteria group bacterium]|nr:hypothetical protein [Patescibacteria group bacterium]